jgi:hypothetical protein
MKFPLPKPLAAPSALLIPTVVPIPIAPLISYIIESGEIGAGLSHHVVCCASYSRATSVTAQNPAPLHPVVAIVNPVNAHPKEAILRSFNSTRRKRYVKWFIILLMGIRAYINYFWKFD